MRLAHYEIGEDTGEFWGAIPGFQGVWACEAPLEGCRSELASVLEDWVLPGIALHHSLPEVDGISLAFPQVSRDGEGACAKCASRRHLGRAAGAGTAPGGRQPRGMGASL